jgi:hypothetical protein
MQRGELGLTNNKDPPFRLATFWTNRSREFFVAPLPDLIGDTGMHISRHRGNHLHIKSNKLGLHEDIDFKSFAKKARTVDDSMLHPRAEGQPARIALVNTEYFLNRTSLNRDKKILLDTNLLSHCTIEIELPDTSHLGDRMNGLRHLGFAKPGDLALIHSLKTNEVSVYAYPQTSHVNHSEDRFFTLPPDVLLSALTKPDVAAISRLLPFTKPLLDPMMAALCKMRGHLCTTSPSLQMLSTLSLKPAYSYKL